MIVISVSGKNIREDTITKLVKGAILEKYPEASVSVTRKEPADTRAKRFEEAKDDVNEAKSVGEELRDELQEWLDGLPENLQGGQKADELQEAIDALEEFVNSLEDADGADVSFPGMY